MRNLVSEKFLMAGGALSSAQSSVTVIVRVETESQSSQQSAGGTHLPKDG